MVLRPKPLMLVCIVALAGMCASVAVVFLRIEPSEVVSVLTLTTFGIGAAAILCVTIRIARFRKRWFGLLRHLLAGNYEIGLPPDGRWRDEITELDRLLERFLEQLRAYDILRAQRIRRSQRTLDAVLDCTVQPVMIYDAEREELFCNPAMQTVLKTSAQNFSLAAMENLESNRGFVEILRHTTETKTAPQQVSVRIQLPPQESHQDVELRIVPIKDKDEGVRTVVLLGGGSSQPTEA